LFTRRAALAGGNLAVAAAGFQHSSVRQRFRYFGVITIFLIVTVGFCWGLAHI
jgi:hypothetical protein